MDVSVILPTYNERGNIVVLLHNIIRVLSKTKKAFELLVVDDNSSDGTAGAIAKAFGRNTHIRVWVRKAQRGLATAIWFGISRARGEYVVVMDTDLSHSPDVIPRMLAEAITHTLVSGSRYIRGGGMENRKRYWLSMMFNIYLRVLFGIPLTDFLSGYLCMKTDAIRKLVKQYPDIFCGYGDYFMRLISAVAKERGTFFEIPVYYRNRPYGVSKSKFIPMFFSYTKSSLRLRAKQ